MTKYTVLAASLKVLASANTLHMAKRAFYDEVKLSPDTNFILLDDKLENYAVFRAGKVVAGRKWKEFVKSSYNVAKPKVAPVKPVDEKAAHIAAFDKWVADNDIAVGDQVKVVKACQSYENGWADVWDRSMDSFVGEVCTVVNLTTMLPGEMRLESPDGAKFYFPHFVLEVVPTVRKICLDVIKQINAQEIVAKVGCMISIGDKPYSIENWRDFSAQVWLKENSCKVCAKGALMVDWVKKFNNMNLGVFNNLATDNVNNYPEEFVALFGRKLLDEIEIAFEYYGCAWCDVNVSGERRKQLKARYSGIENDNQRLIAIMQDVANGTF